jgi:hypothetical protein
MGRAELYPDVPGSDDSNGARIPCRYGEGLVRDGNCFHICVHILPTGALRGMLIAAGANMPLATIAPVMQPPIWAGM